MEGKQRVRNMPYQLGLNNEHDSKRDDVEIIKEKLSCNKHRNDHKANRRQEEQ